MRETAKQYLLEGQNADGGWGTQPGKASNVEATSFALLALGTLRERSLSHSLERGQDWLRQVQRPAGGFPYMAHLREGSWASPLAVIALSFFDPDHSAVLRGVEWVLRRRGSGLGLITSIQYWLAPEGFLVKLNPFLKGWSWTAGTFSWVEPTAYSLIAIKKLGSRLNQDQLTTRISEGERMIYDRMCMGGGWNYGNSSVLGEELWPYPDTTALALIALRNREGEPANRLSLAALEKMLGENHSGLALGWAALCFALYGRGYSHWLDLIEKSYSETKFLGDIKSTALALLAMSGGAEIFRV
jgi:hypothetical protein